MVSFRKPLQIVAITLCYYGQKFRMVRKAFPICGPFNKACDNKECFNQKKLEQNHCQILIVDIVL